MGDNEQLSEPAREPTKLELVKAFTDPPLFELFEGLEETLPALAATQDKGVIREIVADFMRQSLVQGMVIRTLEKDVLDQFLQIVEGEDQ